MRICVFACVAALFFASAAAAQPASIKDPETPIRNFEIATLGPLLTELKIAWRQQTSRGQTYIAAESQGLAFILSPEACRSVGRRNCTGLKMIAIFQGAGFNQQTVNAFNARYAFTSSGIDPSGDAYTSRYDICDYGMARGNFAVGLSVFIAQAKLFRQMIATSPQTRSDAGYSSDLAAASLNRAGLAAATGEEALAVHDVAIDEAATRASDLIADPTTPRNLIERR
ncbi:MAG: YbjN domain-containing protein [Parvularculaceae bacterium]|nr:YbjN domain-containing protein [Parvularculaceae bacterium]